MTLLGLREGRLPALSSFCCLCRDICCRSPPKKVWPKGFRAGRGRRGGVVVSAGWGGSVGLLRAPVFESARAAAALGRRPPARSFSPPTAVFPRRTHRSLPTPLLLYLRRHARRRSRLACPCAPRLRSVAPGVRLLLLFVAVVFPSLPTRHLSLPARISLARHRRASTPGGGKSHPAALRTHLADTLSSLPFSVNTPSAPTFCQPTLLVRVFSSNASAAAVGARGPPPPLSTFCWLTLTFLSPHFCSRGRAASLLTT